jgi:hypothetical protein
MQFKIVYGKWHVVMNVVHKQLAWLSRQTRLRQEAEIMGLQRECDRVRGLFYQLEQRIIDLFGPLAAETETPAVRTVPGAFSCTVW